MRFGVLGQLVVWTDDGRPVSIPGTKVRTVLADLLVHAGHPAPADRLVDDLWGRQPPRNPAGALQAKVSQLRRALDEAEPGGRDLVRSGPSGYLLRSDVATVDADRFEALLARDGHDARAVTETLTEALGLWRGPAYADFRDDEFARGAAARLEEQRLTAVEELAGARLALGEHSLLAGELTDTVAEHPLRERLRALQMRALYRSGRQGEALTSYEELRRRLRDELGVDPGAELTSLHHAILQQDPGLDWEPAAGGPPTNLPEPLTELIGRQDAQREVLSLLTSSRLVTLTGAGGVGKTRLAVAVADEMADTSTCPDGVWLVELGGVEPAAGQDLPRARAEVADAVATVLDVRDDGASGPLPVGEATPSVDRVAGALRGQRLLLVIDNCEHVVEAAAELADRLLSTAPGLRILATGQEPLGLAGETVWPVPPLQLLTSQVADATTLRRSSAAQLFAARAAAASGSFVLDDDNAAAVAAVCRRLDGIPLALELAATRVRALSVTELADLMDDRFDVLTARHRGLPERQQTLRAMIEWSWELLGEPERVLLRRLAVHADGCTVAAAESVCAGDGIRPADVVDLLVGLVDRSLVSVVKDVERTRYRLLESVAAFCLERLTDAGELDEMRRRHAVYYAAVAESSEPNLRGHDQRRWLEHLDAEASNVRAAQDTAVRLGDADLALRLTGALSWHWFLRGRFREANRALTRALAVDGEASGTARAQVAAWRTGFAILVREDGSADAQSRALAVHDLIDDPHARAMAEWFLGFALDGSGALAAGRKLADRALAEFRELGDRWGMAAALSTAASQALVRGDLAAARRDSEDSAGLFRELGDRWGQARVSFTRAALAEIAGDYETAGRLHRDGLRMGEELRLWPEVSYQLSGLGRLALLSGDHAEAEELHEQARRMAVEHADKPREMFAVAGLGTGARKKGDLDDAEHRLRHLLDWNRRMGYEPAIAYASTELGFVAEQRGDVAAARELHLDGFSAAAETGDPRAVAFAMEGIAGACALAGSHRHAAQLLGAAAAARDAVGMPLPDAERGDVDRTRESILRVLDESTAAAEFSRGHALPRERYPDLVSAPLVGT